MFFSLTGAFVDSGQKSVSAVQSSVECYTLLKFDLNFESLSVTLYNSDPTQVCDKAFITQVGWAAKVSHMNRTRVRKIKLYI